MDRIFKTFIKTENGYRYKNFEPTHAIAGDTDSAYVDLSTVFPEDVDLQDVIEFGDFIGEETNKSFDDFLINVFNVPKERADVIETEREVISDKSYFVAKKMYAMHIVDKEGKSVDEMKIMGLSIIKSDTPKLIQDFLKHVVTMLMDRNSWVNVHDEILKFKEIYMGSSIFDIATPKNMKNLTKYQDILAETNSMKGFPYHAKACLNYNELCGVSGRNIYSGDKIKVLYIKHPKYDCMAFPVDMEVIPDFLEDIVIDWDKNWSKVEHKITDFLKPIGYDPVARQIKHNGTFFGW